MLLQQLCGCTFYIPPCGLATSLASFEPCHNRFYACSNVHCVSTQSHKANVWAGIETQEKAKLVFGFHNMAYHPEMIQQPALLKGTGPDQSKCISVVSIIALTSSWEQDRVSSQVAGYI